MVVRGFVGRHRTAAGVLTPIAVGVVLLVASAWALWSAPSQSIDTRLTASTTECHDMVTLSIAGRSDTPRAGTTKLLLDEHGNELPAASSDDYVSTWIDEAANAPKAALGDGAYAAHYIAYPANMASYDAAVATGVANTETVMKAIRRSCPDTKFAIVGYSEGADVARRVAMNIGHQAADTDGGYGIVDPADVLGVVIIADAGRADGQGPFPGARNPFTNPDGFDRPYQNGDNGVPGQGLLPGTGGSDFGTLAGRVASFCADGDLTCAAPQNISLLQLVVNVGRQLNVDALERDGLTPAAGVDVATVLSRIVFDAFVEIDSQPNWMASDETFLTVLLRVSDPDYTGPTPTPTATPSPANTPTARDDSDENVESDPASDSPDSISAEELSPLAYLPQKLFREIVGLIVTNRNTIPVILSDPYHLTLAPEVGRHFAYWRDADAAAGRPLTSVQYAAAWLTHLAQQVQAGKQIDPAEVPTSAELSAAVDELVSSSAAGSGSSSSDGGTISETTSSEGVPASQSDGSVAATPSAAAPVAPPQATDAAPITTAPVTTTPSAAPSTPAQRTTTPSADAPETRESVTGTTVAATPTRVS